VEPLVALYAQGNEVLSNVIPVPAAADQVMNFEVGEVTAMLAPPAISL
jgi:hypothetical protein